MPDPNKKTSFESLIEELDGVDATLAKAMPGGDDDKGKNENDEDDAAIQNAADEDEDEDEDGAGDGGSDGDDDDDKMAKALGVEPVEVIGPDGQKQKAYDGIALLKAMHGRVQRMESGAGGNEFMEKAIGMAAKSLAKISAIVTKQDEMIKSLQQQVTALSGKGGGRKAVISLLEKSIGNDGNGGGNGEEITTEELLTKAQAAAEKRLITAVEVAHVHRMVDAGQMPSADVMQKINQA